MDTQARRDLKTDSFAQATATSVSWLGEHRSSVIRWVVAGVLVLALGIGGIVFWNLRSTAADAALNAALDTYTAPLIQPGAPAEKGSYATAKDRSQAANQQFLAVVQQYGWLPQASKAHYFAGVTYRELNQNSAAETELSAAAASWNRDLANLAKLALAGIYHQSNRDSQAIDVYTSLAAKPSDTVPAGVAKLDLADLYAATGKQDQARKIWAELKDSDKEGAAGEISKQKLDAK